MTTEDILDHLEHPEMPYAPERDISLLDANLTIHDAYQIQFAFMRRLMDKGDRHIGYQASLTSVGAAKAFPQYPSPYLGTLLRSNIKHGNDPVELKFDEYMVETEIGVIFKSDLEGADLTPVEVVRALEGYIGALELAPVRPGTREGRWSAQQLIATHNTGSYIVLGTTVVPPHIDMRTEGAVVCTNNVFRSSAAGIEALGGPINVIIALAKILHGHGLGFKAGQLVITGSLPIPQAIGEGDKGAAVEFTRLGRIAIEFQQ